MKLLKEELWQNIIGDGEGDSALVSGPVSDQVAQPVYAQVIAKVHMQVRLQVYWQVTRQVSWGIFWSESDEIGDMI